MDLDVAWHLGAYKRGVNNKGNHVGGNGVTPWENQRRIRIWLIGFFTKCMHIRDVTSVGEQVLRKRYTTLCAKQMTSASIFRKDI